MKHLQRRRFLTHTGAAAAAATLTSAACQSLTPSVTQAEPQATPAPALDLSTWAGVRASFPLTTERVHLAAMLLASHPKPVSDAMQRYRLALDADPVAQVHHLAERDDAVFKAAAQYIGGDAKDIALTDSTTMGLGLVYTGLIIAPGEELLTTVHGHYSTRESLRYTALRTGATVREVSLYASGATATEGEISGNLRAALRPETRVVAVTWVHSSTGVKLPIAELAKVIAEENAKRDASAQIRFCVDGVHGFGIENVEIPKLGCDFFIAGTHKWIFGPRGTGMIWGSERGWASVRPAIPPFDWSAFGQWIRGEQQSGKPSGRLFTPGGFHSFEHRWALKEAFEMHLSIGKARIQRRIHELAGQAKDGLAKMKHITLHTPRSSAVSSGIVCFEVAGLKPDEAVKRLLSEHGIIASTTPYATSYARLSTACFNTDEEIERALAAIAGFA